MCTASWLFHSQGYRLFFNRDELHTRATALPPTTIDTDYGCTIMPVDPDGGGTWLGVNSSGWTFALLNNYQGQTPEGELLSRGTIVKQALQCRSISQLELLIASFPLVRYAPFSLLCLTPPQASVQDHELEEHGLPERGLRKRGLQEFGLQNTGGNTLLWRWNGKRLQPRLALGFLTSSSRQYESTKQSRTTEAFAFNLLPGNPALSLCHPGSDDVQQRTARHRAFHRSHSPSCNAKSVCMHRDDASTVSYSEIAVLAHSIEFHYINGAPCAGRGEPAIEIPRTVENPVRTGTGNSGPSNVAAPPNSLRIARR